VPVARSVRRLGGVVPGLLRMFGSFLGVLENYLGLPLRVVAADYRFFGQQVRTRLDERLIRCLDHLSTVLVAGLSYAVDLGRGRWPIACGAR
jgi:hypothetical protein